MKRFPLCNALQALLVLILAGLVGGLSLAPLPAAAQTSAEARSELLGQAMEARLQGNYQQADSLLEELVRLDPGNTAVQTLYEKNKRDLEGRGGAPAPVVVGSGSTGGDLSVASSDSGSIDDLLNSANQVVADSEAAADEALYNAEQLAEAEQFDAASAQLQAALAGIPATPGTEDVREDLLDALAEVSEAQIVIALEDGDIVTANGVLSQYQEIAGSDDFVKDARRAIRSFRNNPFNYRLEDLAPEFAATQERVEQALVEGRARYLMGDLNGARADFNLASKLDPNNVEAKAFLARIAENLARRSENDRYVTHETLIESVNRGWTLPGIYRGGEDDDVDPITTEIQRVRDQLSATNIPFVRFTDVPLDRAMETLAEASTRYSPVVDAQGNPVGLNIVIFARGRPVPNVSVTLNQEESLDVILELVCSAVDWQYIIGDDGVIRVQPDVTGGGGRDFRTEFYDISAAALIRMGVDDGGGGGGGGAGAFDPFAAPAPDPFGGGGGGGGGNDARGEQVRSFLENAGIDFQGVPGARLAFTGTQIIVTHTAQAHEQIRDILRQFVQIEQVEIEAKFIEVEEGTLQELGFNWNINNGANNVYRTFGSADVNALNRDAGNGTVSALAQQSGINNRGLASAFATASSTLGNGNIISPTVGTLPIINMAPTFPGSLNLASDAVSSANIFGVVDDWNVNLVINALEQQSGSDLMSAPRLTVLSGKTAEIVVAQELRYPESYGDIEAEVSEGDGIGGSGAGVAITAGTPQDFTTRRVGVEMEVQPNVEGGDRISLRLEPTVTEFEGFVEYGGQSVAISGPTVVTVPSGFFQPIFSVRQIRTEVTVFDGATVIMGGLTREEVSRVEDKVPVLGDIPVLGRMFRSEGESSLKTNLMIFVTARLISPGGAPLNEETEVRNEIFKPSTIISPGGPITRSVDFGGAAEAE